MKKSKKSGRITLRVTPEVHQQLANVAEDLWLDLNGTLNLLIGRSLGPVAVEARLLRLYREKASDPDFNSLIAAWKEANPKGKRGVFVEEFRKYVLGEPSELDGLTSSNG